MAANQWFVCLNYSQYDLLIPQSMVTGSNWLEAGSTIVCNGTSFSADVIPHLVQLSLSDCRVFPGEIGTQLLRKGIIGVHFTDRTVQYLVDDRFLQLTEERHSGSNKT